MFVAGVRNQGNRGMSKMAMAMIPLDDQLSIAEVASGIITQQKRQPCIV